MTKKVEQKNKEIQAAVDDLCNNIKYFTNVSKQFLTIQQASKKTFCNIYINFKIFI